MKKGLKYDDLSNSINTIQEILQKEIAEYSKAYKKVNKNDTLDFNTENKSSKF